MLEARAKRRNIRSSPRKMRLVIDLIRGKNATEALNILRFMPNRASLAAEQTLRSAVANLFNKDDRGSLDEDAIFVKAVFVDQGVTMKRMLPAPQGRAYRMRKRSNHLTIVVGTK
ncbi:MAG: 50S ribosomal protein L22 [Chlorobi bacterium]|jgi:large subunit ribosomal protein L22|nr:50S ribosomal protein L22 [Chlorobiota bacterium]